MASHSIVNITAEHPYLTLAGISLGLYALYLFLLPKPLPGIPYNAHATKSILGDAPSMLREVSQTQQVMKWMATQARTINAPLCQVFIRPFSRPWVLLADYREAQDVLLRRGRDFDRSSFTGDLMAPAGGFHLRHRTGKEWKAARSLLQDLMTPSFLNNVAAPAIYNKTLDLVKLWELKMKLANGRPFSAALDIHYAALDAVLAFTFGGTIKESAVAPQLELLSQLKPMSGEDHDAPVAFEKPRLHEFLESTIDGTHVIEKIINSPSPKLTVWWLKFTPWYKRFLSIKNRFIREQIGIAVERLGKSQEGKFTVRSAVDHIMTREEVIAEKQSRKTNFYNQNMIDEIFGNIVAGHDTTSSALSWVLKFLTDQPETYSKLRQALVSTHVVAHAAGRNPSLAELIQSRVPYLDAVIEEALRLSPISVTREATHDTELLGHHIPKGTVVFMLSNGPSFYTPSFEIEEEKRSPTSRQAAISRQWDEKADMSAFRPERWLRQTAEESTDALEFDSTAGPQLVFGLGTRSCFGKRLAYLEMRIITTMIVWNFELLSVPPDLAGDDAVDGVTHRAQKCFVRLKKTAP